MRVLVCFLFLLSSHLFCDASLHQEIKNSVTKTELNIRSYLKNSTKISKKPGARTHFQEKVFNLCDLSQVNGFEEIKSLKWKGKLRTIVRKVLRKKSGVHLSFRDNLGDLEVDLSIENESLIDIVQMLADEVNCKVTYSKIGARHHFEFWKYQIIDFTLSLSNTSHKYSVSFLDGDESEGDGISLKSKNRIPSFWEAIQPELLMVLQNYTIEEVYDISPKIISDRSRNSEDLEEDSDEDIEEDSDESSDKSNFLKSSFMSINAN
ncbi:hypothetical protein MJH12_16380, partial [bacterium]|nr:hypothetical protein [bacterium]